MSSHWYICCSIRLVSFITIKYIIDSCSDNRPNCFRYKTFGWCEKRKSAMKGVCARTCGLCGKFI